MAAKIIKEGAHVSKMQVQADDKPVKKYNPTICERLNLPVPEGFVALD